MFGYSGSSGASHGMFGYRVCNAISDVGDDTDRTDSAAHAVSSASLPSQLLDCRALGRSLRVCNGETTRPRPLPDGEVRAGTTPSVSGARPRVHHSNERKGYSWHGVWRGGSSRLDGAVRDEARLEDRRASV